MKKRGGTENHYLAFGHMFPTSFFMPTLTSTQPAPKQEKGSQVGILFLTNA